MLGEIEQIDRTGRENIVVVMEETFGSVESWREREAEVVAKEKAQAARRATAAVDREVAGFATHLPGAMSEEETMRLINGSADAEVARDIEALKALDPDLRGHYDRLRGVN